MEKCSDKDYWGMGNASLNGEMPRQGLFFGCGCISGRRNARVKIIFGPVDASLVEEMSGQGLFLDRWMHPWSEKCPDKDYFAAADASLVEEMFGQGLFLGRGCILGWIGSTLKVK